MNKSLKINPPEGEFVVMNYRVTTDFAAPFKVYTFFETVSQYKVELMIKVKLYFIQLKATFPKEIIASFISVKFAVPKKVSNITPEVVKNHGNQKADYS